MFHATSTVIDNSITRHRRNQLQCINSDAARTTHRLTTKGTQQSGLLTGGARAGCLRRRAEEEQRQALDGAALASPTRCADFRGRHRGTRDEIIRRFEQRQALLVLVGVDVAALAGRRRRPDVVVVFVRIILLRIVVRAAGISRLHDARRRRPFPAGRVVLLQGIREVRRPVPGPRAVVNSLSCRRSPAVI